MPQLDNKIAVVTGGSSGPGRTAAKFIIASESIRIVHSGRRRTPKRGRR